MEHSHNKIIEQVPLDYYQKGTKNNWFQKTWHSNKLRTVLSLIPNQPKTILDVGCASGWFLSQVQKKFPKAQCYGIDIYEQAIAYGKRLYPTIHFARANAQKLPYSSEKFDIVISTEVLEHVDDPKHVLLEIKRVLKKGGYGVIELDSGSVLFSISWYLWRKFSGKVWNDSHLHSFNVKKLGHLMEDCGFRIIKKKTFNWDMAM